VTDLEKIRERELLLKRLFWSDRQLYQLGKDAAIEWFSMFDLKFTKDQYAFFAEEEKKEARVRILGISDDQKFIDVLNKAEPPKYMEIDRFVGEHYYYDANVGKFALENKTSILRGEVRDALKETKERGYSFLKAIIELYKKGKWDQAYGGVTWIDILSKIRELGGKYPSPRDLAILKSYRIYYKTGSNRYPTHTVPEEMIPVIDDELENWRKTVPGSA
jgi:hypothetical protein